MPNTQIQEAQVRRINLITANNIVSNEVPTGTINGTNKAFTLLKRAVANSVRLYLNGVRQNPNVGAVVNDHAITETTTNGVTTTTITFNTAPVVGDVILVDYLTA